jgi:hypothetical protein
MAQRLNTLSAAIVKPDFFPTTPALSLRFPFQRIAAVAGFARPCNLNQSNMKNKNARTGTGKPVLVLAVDFRQNANAQTTADVLRQFETCEFYAERHKLKQIDFSVINHQHLLGESKELSALIALLQKLNIKTVLIRKSNRLSVTGFFQKKFSAYKINITWVTVNYDQPHRKIIERQTSVPMVFRFPSSWEQLL